MPQRETIIEQVRFGHALRVTAVDVATGTEAVFQAPLTAGAEEIRRLAQAKLDYVMKKNGV